MTTAGGGGGALPSLGPSITVDEQITLTGPGPSSDKLFILFQISAGPGGPGSQVSDDDQIVDYNYSKVSKQIFHATAGWWIS